MPVDYQTYGAQSYYGPGSHQQTTVVEIEKSPQTNNQQYDLQQQQAYEQYLNQYYQYYYQQPP